MRKNHSGDKNQFPCCIQPHFSLPYNFITKKKNSLIFFQQQSPFKTDKTGQKNTQIVANDSLASNTSFTWDWQSSNPLYMESNRWLLIT